VFVELCAKSNFSFLEGASHPEELVSYARELGLPAIGIADRDGIYGLVRAYREVKERGGKLVSGAELTIEYDGSGASRRPSHGLPADPRS
jgi:error-prone DNA polymerase